MSDFSWRHERRRWFQRDHPTQRRGVEHYHEEYGYRIQHRGHRASHTWYVVFNEHGEFVLDPTHSRFWVMDLEDVQFTLSKREWDLMMSEMENDVPTVEHEYDSDAVTLSFEEFMSNLPHFIRGQNNEDEVWYERSLGDEE